MRTHRTGGINASPYSASDFTEQCTSSGGLFRAFCAVSIGVGFDPEVGYVKVNESVVFMLVYSFLFLFPLFFNSVLCFHASVGSSSSAYAL